MPTHVAAPVRRHRLPREVAPSPASDTVHLDGWLLLQVGSFHTYETTKIDRRSLTAGRLEPFSLPRVRGGECFDRNKYGSIVYRNSGGEFSIEQLTQLFKNAELWGMNTELDRVKGRGDIEIIPNGYEDAFVRALDNYTKFARNQLQLTLPLRLVAGITGIDGFKMAAPPGMHFSGFEAWAGRAVEPDVVFETMLNDWNIPPAEVLKPFFERVWDAFGLQRPEMAT